MQDIPEADVRVAEREITMIQLLQAQKEGRILEMFGSGTACTVSQVGEILYKGERLRVPAPVKNSLTSRVYDRLSDIQSIVCMIISKVGSWAWYIPRRFAGIVVGVVSESRHSQHHTTARQETIETDPLTKRVLNNCGISPSALDYSRFLYPYVVWCTAMNCIHENPLHSTSVLGMLIRVCHIVTQSSFPRSYHSLSCPVRSVCHIPGSHNSLDPCHLICAIRGIIRPPLRPGD
ncbi:unnamed protein product [Protopolystoma xenopodis]|uniref:Uncharacterized protein n=1 Tax=Protopolystoma xenopodis TaxID=117903 RepID=A0A3S5C3I6_9PLAT|nr:unnamed protein product [Protopolystoma xenopodis]